MRKLRVEELGRVDIDTYREQPKYPIVIVLDQVRSMHNVGAVFRSSDAFNIEKIYLCGITPTPPHREIRKTAIGAEKSVSWEYISKTLDITQKLKSLGYQLIAVEQAENSTLLHEWKPDTDQKYALILGHEITGVDQKVLDACDIAIEIPQFGTKHSLNISVAAGIVMNHLTMFFYVK